MKKIIPLCIMASILLLPSCLKKAPSVSFAGRLYSKHGAIMKQTPLTFITDMNHSESARVTYTTDVDGYFSINQNMTHKNLMGIECITDSGSYKNYNLTKEDLSALSYTLALQ